MSIIGLAGETEGADRLTIGWAFLRFGSCVPGDVGFDCFLVSHPHLMAASVCKILLETEKRLSSEGKSCGRGSELFVS